MVELLNTLTVLHDVSSERVRQEELRQSGKFLWTCAARDVSPDRKMSVLSEEVGEVAQEIVELGITTDKYVAAGMPFPPHRRRHYLELIRKELIQVAAVCVAWVEAIDTEFAEEKLTACESALGQTVSAGEGQS